MSKGDLPVILTCNFFQLKMLESKKELTNEHTFGSRPSWWPLMRRGVAFWIAKDTNVSLIVSVRKFIILLSF